MVMLKYKPLPNLSALSIELILAQFSGFLNQLYWNGSNMEHLRILPDIQQLKDP